MATIRTQIVVTKCSDCPFFERTLVHALGDLFTKRETNGGTCKYNGMGFSFPLGRMHVPDERMIPATCPLRSGDVVVELKL